MIAVACLAACARPSADGEGGTGDQGSDALTGVVQAWAEAYQEVGAGVAVAGGSSSARIAALIDGTEDLAFASRRMNDRERDAARSNGFEPIEHVVGLDALAIYLHHDNPAEWLSALELAEIYGEGGAVETWSQLMEYAIPGCDNDEITRFSRPRDSAAHLYFNAAVLGDERDARSDVRVFDDPKQLVERVKKTPCAIGYSSMVHAVEHVKLACVSTGNDESATRDGIADAADTSDCVAPSPATAVDRSYPLTRPLLMITRGEPQGAVKAYLDWILADAGQCILQDRGYAPARAVSCPSSG